MRLLAVVLAAGVAAIPATLVLIPFWRWLEATSGLESIGHSGPAEWCYVATLLSCTAVMWLISTRASKRK